MIDFLRSRCSTVPAGYTDRAEIAIEALKIADGQGLSGDGNKPESWYPWHRAFTFGDVNGQAEWLAEIYCDIDLARETGRPYDGYRRVLIGAPLWIRTPYIKAVRLYEEYEASDLDGADESPSFEGEGLLRRIARRLSVRSEA